MNEENSLKNVCQQFLDPIAIKDDEVEGIIKDGQMYLNFLDSISQVGYAYSTRGSYQIGPEKLDDLPEEYHIKLHFDQLSGLPYLISKCVKMQCKYGTNYYGSKKLDDPEKKKRNYVSKKIGCESSLKVKIRHMFTNKRYRNGLKKTAYKRRKMVEELHERLKSTNNKPLSVIWYYISLKLTHTHPPQPEVKTENDEDDFQADNSNLVFNEVEVQTTSPAEELKATLRELLIDTVGMTYNLPEDEESVENIKDLIFRASSLKSAVEAFLNPDEAKRPRFQSFVKRKKIQKTVDTLQKEARIKDSKWNIPSGKKRKVTLYKPLEMEKSLGDVDNLEVEKTMEDEISQVKKESIEDGLSVFEKEMLEASKRAEEALEADMFTEEEQFVQEEYLEQEMFEEEEGQTEEEEEHAEKQQPREIKVLKVSTVWGGYLNVELVSVNAKELADSQFTN